MGFDSFEVDGYTVANYMPHDYDSPGWWETREFEHRAEGLAITKLLENVEKRRNIIDIGAGFGRLTPIYASFFSKITLVDPSERLLSFAENYLQNLKRVEFKRGSLEKLPTDSDLFDVALCVRVLHLFKGLGQVSPEIYRVLKSGGYLILEFSPRNHKPEQIKRVLTWNGFEIQKTLSVSNIRFSWLKKFLPMSFLLKLEDRLEEPLARFSFSDSSFILAQKIGTAPESIVKPLPLDKLDI